MKTPLLTKLAALTLSAGIVAAVVALLFTPAHARHPETPGASSPGITRVIVVGKRWTAAEKAAFDERTYTRVIVVGKRLTAAEKAAFNKRTDCWGITPVHS